LLFYYLLPYRFRFWLALALFDYVDVLRLFWPFLFRLRFPHPPIATFFQVLTSALPFSAIVCGSIISSCAPAFFFWWTFPLSGKFRPLPLCMLFFLHTPKKQNLLVFPRHFSRSIRGRNARPSPVSSPCVFPQSDRHFTVNVEPPWAETSIFLILGVPTQSPFS